MIICIPNAFPANSVAANGVMPGGIAFLTDVAPELAEVLPEDATISDIAPNLAEVIA